MKAVRRERAMRRMTAAMLAATLLVALVAAVHVHPAPGSGAAVRAPVAVDLSPAGRTCPACALVHAHATPAALVASSAAAPEPGAATAEDRRHSRTVPLASADGPRGPPASR